MRVYLLEASFCCKLVIITRHYLQSKVITAHDSVHFAYHLFREDYYKGQILTSFVLLIGPCDINLALILKRT